MADSTGDIELDAFRTEARTWLEANFPAALKGKAGQAYAASEGGEFEGDLLAWKQAIRRQGAGQGADLAGGIRRRRA